MFKLFSKAFGMLAIVSVVTGILYPLAVTAVAKAAFPDQAGGSLVVRHGKVVGSRLVGQSFTDSQHFWGRLSATTPHPYNAAASTGSNLGPTNAQLTKNARDRIASLRAADPDNVAPVPVDLVTASASGLDPHISPAAAEYQVRRVARARGVPEEQVRRLVENLTEGRTFGLLGEPRINVLRLNLALDEELPSRLSTVVGKADVARDHLPATK